MAVEQMKYASIIGPVRMFDEFVLKYIINKNIQLDPSYNSINTSGLIPFESITSFDSLRKRMRSFNDKFDVGIKIYDKKEIEKELIDPIDIAATDDFIKEIEDKLSEFKRQSELYESKIKEKRQILKQIQPLEELELDIDELFRFSFMKFRFGFLAKANYLAQKSYLEELDVIAIPVSEEDGNVWLSYFMPSTKEAVIDSVFSAIGFERVRISGEVKGKPKAAIENLNEEINLLIEKSNQNEEAITRFIASEKDRFQSYYNKVTYYSKINEVKRLAAHDRELFFLVGWIPLSYHKEFCQEMEPLKQIILKCEDPESLPNLEPPTILKNNSLFKPFESLVNMYGTPTSRELDPTPLTAITFVLMFGLMFGDVGQGALLALFGFYLYWRKKSALGGIMMYAGISSTIFGFVYGSVFGSEAFIEPLWLNPLHSKDTINTLLYGAVGYGAIIIILTIVLNMINNFRMRNWGKLLFDRNGLAGFLFFGGTIVIIINAIRSGKLAISALTLVLVIVIPAIMIFLKEPFTNLIYGKDHIFPAEKGIYFVEAGFDLFETIMSFFSGTVSFARVGAFALNHAGLSLAIWTLYGMMHGVGGVIVVIFGNLLTIGLEGLIVGIQCMRLEYYEMFGRFYTGEGKEFKPVTVFDN